MFLARWGSRRRNPGERRLCRGRVAWTASGVMSAVTLAWPRYRSGSNSSERGSLRVPDEVASPDSFSAVEWENRPLPTHARPRSGRQVLHPVYAKAAVDGDALALREHIVRSRRAPPLPVPGPFISFGLAPFF